MKKIHIVLVLLSIASLLIWQSCSKDDEDDKSGCISFKDSRDNQEYSVVKIGNQCWMAQNLNFTTSQDSWCYEEKESNCNKHGRLYSWSTAMEACPQGWEIPTETAWQTLEQNLGMSASVAAEDGWRGTNEAEKLKPNGSTGFNVLISGKKGPGNTPFSDLDIFGYYWSATSNQDVPEAWLRVFSPSESRILKALYGKDYFFSVRCIKVE